jgi:hypothetical protein
MPGHIAPAYVATDANPLITTVTAGWFGGGTWQRLTPQSVCVPLVSRRATFTALCARGARM